MPTTKRKPKSRYEKHKARWRDCEDCSLCHTRTKTVFARGVFPCDVLFIGEAPGVSEDALGKPFVGPAGKLLDDLIAEACRIAEANPKLAFSNLVCCIPVAENGAKISEPPEETIEACSIRLREFVITVAKPKMLIFVGRLAAKHAPKYLNIDLFEPVEIVHPAAILRADVTQKGLACQRTISTISTAFSELNL